MSNSLALGSVFVDSLAGDNGIVRTVSATASVGILTAPPTPGAAHVAVNSLAGDNGIVRSVSATASVGILTTIAAPGTIFMAVNS